jgi:methyl-accepting chemotaxis protein
MKLDQLVPDIQKTAGLVQEISAASKEQTTGTEQINRAIQQLDRITQQNAATSEELAATAEALAGQAEQLQQATAFFHIDSADQQGHSTAAQALSPTDGQKASALLASSAQDEESPAGPHQNTDTCDDEFIRY